MSVALPTFDDPSPPALGPQSANLPSTESICSAPYLAELDAAQFANDFNRNPFLIDHHLVGHPLFELPRLIELYRTLPEKDVEFKAGDVAVGEDSDVTPRSGLSVEETIHRIEECSALIVLRNVEQHPEYAPLVHGCLDQLQPLTEPHYPVMSNRESFIFVSSPGALTHYHYDPEHNFLLQIRGQKQVAMFDPLDRELVSEEDLERFYCENHRTAPLPEGMRDRGTLYDLPAGRGLHFPVAAPHWVRNGPELSVSFSFTFRSEWSERRESLYRWNYRMRRRGVNPSPVGHSPLVDATKFGMIRAGRVVKRLLGR